MKQTSAILSILLLAFVLRLVHLDQSLWLDEAISAIAARDFTFNGIVYDFLKADNHPPLFYLALRAWGLLVGFSDVGLRLLSVLLGILTVLMTFLIGKKLTNSTKFSVTASILIATSPLHVYYSQELRMYPMITFEAAALIYFFLQLFNERVRKRYWLLFSFFLTCFVATDYVTLFLLPILLIYSISHKKSAVWWILFICTGIPSLVFAVLWFPFFINQSQVGKNFMELLPQWAVLSGGANLKELLLIWMKFVLGRISLTDKTSYYTLIGLSSIPFLFLLTKASILFKKYQLVWYWLLIPLILAFLSSFIIPAFTYFRFIYCLPAFYLLLAVGLRSIQNRQIQKITALIILIINLFGVGIYYVDTNQQRENWKQAIQHLEISGEAEDIAIFEFPEPIAPYRWYSRGEIEGFGALDSLSIHEYPTRIKLESKLAQVSGNVYHFSYLRDLTDKERKVEKILVQLGYSKTISTSFHGVGEISKFEKDFNPNTSKQ